MEKATIYDYARLIRAHCYADDECASCPLKSLHCKVGDTVYQTDTAGQIYASTVKNIIYDTSSIAFDERAIGTTVFLTKEQAEKALKEGATNE